MREGRKLNGWQEIARRTWEGGEGYRKWKKEREEEDVEREKRVLLIKQRQQEKKEELNRWMGEVHRKVREEKAEREENKS